MRDFDTTILGNLEIRNEFVHMTRNGQRFLVLHGDPELLSWAETMTTLKTHAAEVA